MAREPLSMRIGAGRDEGSALVAVIGVMVVLTVLAMTIVSTSLFNIRTTTSTRASAQAKAAAESGIDVARSRLASGAAACGATLTESNVYDVVITCPSSSTFLVTSRGHAKSPGVGGSEGNARTMEALLSRPVVLPSFDKAVYVGASDTHLNSHWSLNGAAASDPNIGGYYQRGDFKCSSNGSITGPIVITGNATISSGCAVKGDIYIKGDLLQCEGSSVQGNIYVHGKVTGYFNCSVTGSLEVAGSIDGIAGTISGSVTSSTGTITGWSPGTISGSLRVASLPPSFEGGKLGGLSCAFPGHPRPNVYGCISKILIASSPLPKLPPSTFDEQMPVVSLPPGTGANWAGYIRSAYVRNGPTTGSAAALNRFSLPADTCKMKAPATVGQDSSGYSLNGPLFSPVGATILDARSCSSLEFSETSTIVLNNDLTILVNNFTSSNGLRVTKGPLATPGSTPTLRIITPMVDGTSKCSENSGGGTIKFDSGGTVLGEDVSLMLYSAGKVDISNTMSFYGQLYACQMAEAKNNVTINFRPVGGSSSGSPSAPGAYALTYLRDVTGS